MKFSLPRTITEARLYGLGYEQINAYSDGVILLENADGIRTFVRPDGTVTVPHTTATVDAKSLIVQAGVKVSA